MDVTSVVDACEGDCSLTAQQTGNSTVACEYTHYSKEERVDKTENKCLLRPSC